MNRKIIAAAVLVPAMLLSLTACFESDADVASKNVSKAADNFEVLRRIVFFNGITDTYLLSIEGFCSLGNDDPEYRLSVTCDVGKNPQTGKEEYKKHFLGLSDNVSYFVEQVQGAAVSKDHYRVVFKPSTIIPDIDIR